MPLTPNFSIFYPCVGDNIDCADFEQWAQSIETALDTVGDQADLAANRPRWMGFANAAIGTGVTTPMVWTTVFFGHPDIVNLGASVQVNRAGVYMASAQFNAPSTTATVTNTQGNVTNGPQTYQRDLSFTPPQTQPPDINVSGLLICGVGTLISANFLWAGTVGPIPIEATLSIAFICEV